MFDFKTSLETGVREEVIHQLRQRFSDAEIARKAMAITLLSESAKTIKDGTTLNGILYLSPAREVSRKTLCPWSSPACRAACIIHSGRMRMENAGQARIFRTIKLLIFPDIFKIQLIQEIAAHQERAIKLGKTPVIRLNGTSDLQTARVLEWLPVAQFFDALPQLFPDVMFSEYTKNPQPSMRPINQSVTLSYSGTNLNQALEWLQSGGNVAVVFREKLPQQWNGHRVIDGEKHDNRYKDESGVVVGLKLKGNRLAQLEAIEGGFAV